MENPFEIIVKKLDKIEELLLEIKYKNKEKANYHPPLMTVQSVAEYLSLAKQTIYGLSSRRKIPHIKRGMKLYFQKSEIDAWLIKHKKKTREEIEDEIKTELYIQQKKGRNF